MMAEPKRHLAPVVDDQTRVLVLGSLPGEASLLAGQYYAHPRNAFWPLVGGLIGRDLVALTYPDKLDVIRAAGVGLWDVVAQAHRSGSLDTSIRSAVDADLPSLIANLPNLRVIAFNGRKAATSGRRILSGRHTPPLVDLPSSSPALAKPLAWKAESWAVLKDYLPPS